MTDRGAALSPNRAPLCLLLALLFLGLCLVVVADSSARRGTRSGMSTANLMASPRTYSRALGRTAAGRPDAAHVLAQTHPCLVPRPTSRGIAP